MTAEFDANPSLPGVPDPYPIYRAVRETDPVHWCPDAKLWAITRYADAEVVLKSNQFGRQAYLDQVQARLGDQPIVRMQRHELVFTDNPRHHDQRVLIASVLTPKSMQALQPQVLEFIERQLGSLRSQGRMDVIEDFARTYPTQVAAMWLGVPESERAQIVEWIFPLVAGRGLSRDPESTAAANRAAEDFSRYFRELIARRRSDPQDDLVSGFVQAAATSGGLMSDDDLISLFIAVFAAGHGPGIALLANTLLALLQHPEEWDRLRSHPEWVPSAVEEGLRFDPPTQAPNPLAALADVEVGGKQIRRGDVVSVIIGAVNRDPAAFPDPERFDITRHPNRHLAFSGGEHFCLGATLARVEGQLALKALVQGFPGLRLAVSERELTWIPHDRFRTLARLPVAWGAS